jgi:hypothetical protein
VPEIFEFGLALDRFSVGEISDRIIATDRKLGLFASRGGCENNNEQ